MSCQQEKNPEEEKPTLLENERSLPDHIVVISINAPEKYLRNVSKDSLGDSEEEKQGPKFLVDRFKFVYKGNQNRIEKWIPEANVPDTLRIEVNSDYLEMATNTPFTLQKQTYLFRKGDTVIINYENKFPMAEVLNREVKEEELNYTRVRLKELFDNKYPSHMRLMFGFSGNEQQRREHEAIELKNALTDTQRELNFIDSLYVAGKIDLVNRDYRVSATKALMSSHLNRPQFRLLLKEDSSFQQEKFSELYQEDLMQADSLIAFHHFRDYLNTITKYDLPLISEEHNAGGKFYRDSRKRFDSIVEDKRFDQLTKNYLLKEAFHDIGRNFGIEDKKKYFEKLQEEVTNREVVKNIQKEYKLDFSTSDQMVLRKTNNDLTTFSEVVAANKGKIILMEYWASWCTPCTGLEPERDHLLNRLNKEEVAYLRLAINDKYEDWMEMAKNSETKEYYIENANVSQVVEDLGIETIPHFMLLNQEGVIVEGFAERPGKGLLAQIKTLQQESGKSLGK